MTVKKPYRVTQYQQASDLGAALFNGPNPRRIEEVGTKDFRWRWTARLFSYFHTGESAGLGLRLFHCRTEDLRDNGGREYGIYEKSSR